jgi:SulP family sulfate permease
LKLHRFHPRLLDTLRGYTREMALRDMGAGITVGIVALPLAMAFAIASGLPPQAGLWTAIIGGFLISALGGSHVQIGGPAGAFIVIVYGIVERHGVANLLISTALAGLLLIALGLLRLGSLVRYVPVGIVIGFTNGIAILIALSQIKDGLGLQIAKMPADFFSMIAVIGQHLSGLNPYAVLLTALCVGGLALWPRLWREDSRLAQLLDQPGMKRASRTAGRIPGPIVALISLSLLAWALKMPVETIGSRFGGIAQELPQFALPEFSWVSVKQLLSPILTIAALGAIESLLCARIGDQVARSPDHDPNQELIAQGVANAVVPFIGGMPVTGTVARTVTNARSGAATPVAGMVHALTLLAVVLVAAPLAAHVPMAVLAGILLFVAWNMFEGREFVRLRQLSNHYRAVMLGTFFLTVVFDLTVALEVGMLLACVLFVKRMGHLFTVKATTHVVQKNVVADATVQPDSAQLLRFTLEGSLFFGAVTKLDVIAQALRDASYAGNSVSLDIDCSELISLDTSGLDALHSLSELARSSGGSVKLRHLREQPLSLLKRSGLEADFMLLN